MKHILSPTVMQELITGVIAHIADYDAGNITALNPYAGSDHTELYLAWNRGMACRPFIALNYVPYTDITEAAERERYLAWSSGRLTDQFLNLRCGNGPLSTDEISRNDYTAAQQRSGMFPVANAWSE